MFLNYSVFLFANSTLERTRTLLDISKRSHYLKDKKFISVIKHNMTLQWPKILWTIRGNTEHKNPTVLAVNDHYSISKNCDAVLKICFPICIWHIRIILKHVFTLRVTQILLKCLSVCLSVCMRLRSMLSHFHMSAHWSHIRIDISREAAPLHSGWSRTLIYFHLCCNYKA